MPRYVRDLFTGELKEVPFEDRRQRTAAPAPKDFIPVQAIRSGRPWRSRAVGVHPTKVEESNKRLQELGISGEYRKDGVFQTESKSARNEMLRAGGYIDRDGGYSDHC